MIETFQHLAVMPFPDIGPLSIKWYGLAYVAGILLGWFYARKIVTTPRLWRNGEPAMKLIDIDDFVFWAAIGIVLGGRLGYVLVYNLPATLADPLSVFRVWDGGMSFHGGFAGTVLAMILFARNRSIAVWSLFDVVAAVCVTGLFFGRIANFINGELWGKVSFLPWAVIFPRQEFPRHPSQLYEAGLEGLLTGLILAYLIFAKGKLKSPGFIAGAFVALYALSRITVEFVREPDIQIGYLLNTNWLTMGMVLSIPMLLLGLWAMRRATVAARSLSTAAP